MKQRVYIDTSVIGGCCDEEFAEWSQALFKEFRAGAKVAVVSDLTYLELKGAPEDVQNALKAIPAACIETVALDDEALMLLEIRSPREVLHEKEI